MFPRLRAAARRLRTMTLEPVKLLTSDESQELVRIRHSTSHVMAMAVQRLYPNAQVTIGPWTKNGFYYDFDFEEPLVEKDLKRIKQEMIKIITKGLKFEEEVVSVDEAQRRIREIGEPYKEEILDGILERDPDVQITIWHTGRENEKFHWWDLCGGPHVETTKDINPKAFDLESIAGAYWRGDENKQMLTRIYGTAWSKPEELEAYKKMKDEAKRRDHRLLGKKLDLFSIQEDAGGGLVFWHPRGAMMRHIIENYWIDKHINSPTHPYELVNSPHIAKQELWKTSGHLDFYSDSMFQGLEVEEEKYQLKPMNCPFHVMIYKDKMRSYRDLPIRFAELGTVYRYEKSGTLAGLFRVRGFTQDDAHIFCLPDQIADEIVGVLDLMEEILSAFGFSEYEINLSTRPEKSVGSDAIWQKAEDALRVTVEAKGWVFDIDEGGGAFYGPKIDVKIKDAIGRKWQCSTIQLDFNLPERFDLEYTDSEGKKQRPIMIHRAIFGSVERFFGILIENSAGDFPLWIAPEQVRILPITDTFLDHCHKVRDKLKDAGFRVSVVTGAGLGKLIRNAELEKIPVMAVVGKQEFGEGTLNVRTRSKGELGALTLDSLMEQLSAAVADKSVM